MKITRNISKMMNHIFSILVVILITSKALGAKCPLPLQDCSTQNIKFFLYTCLESPPQELILHDPALIAKVKFAENADFKFLIHGYTQGKNSPEWIIIREEYLKEKQWNLVVVDYSPIAQDGCYFETLKPSVVKLGECIGDFLRLIFKLHGQITIDKFHFVGFSVGSHICAQISNNLQPTGLIIPRITGCDPALIGFSQFDDEPEKNILNRQHARFVDIIHTNAGLAGVIYSNAHLDFYANNGEVQPGCEETHPECSHSRSLELFAESIRSSVKFIAQKCDSKDEWINKKKCTGGHHLTKEVGEHCTPPKTDVEIGIYQFPTNAKKPFAIAPPAH